MNRIRTQIKLALDSLIEECNGTAFQRLACQCLRSRWPSLASVAEQNDLGEDAISIFDETSDGVVRSLACSLTAKWSKVSSDANKIAHQRSDVHELIFATPKTITRKTQRNWEERIRKQYGWKLIVVERSEFLAVLERPESQWICKQHLNLAIGYLHFLKAAETARESGEVGTTQKMAYDAERGAINAGDWETTCRAQILLAELHSDKEGLCASYRDKALEALFTAKEHGLTSLLAECLALRANSIIGEKPQEARILLQEAEAEVGENLKIMRWIYLIRAELEHSQGDLDKAEEALDKWESLAGKGGRIDRQGFHHIKFRLAGKRDNNSNALEHLNKALKHARFKKRWISVGGMLHEKARYLAHKGNFLQAAREAEKAREVLGKTNLKGGVLDSALLAGHLFLECHSAERALGLADYVIKRADADEFENMLQDAYQLKTKSLQVLGRIKEAREWNSRIRNLVSHEPQALVVTDIQDAMLYAQESDYAKAESSMETAMKRARSTKVPEEIIAAIKVNWAQVKMDQAKYREARSLALEALLFGEKLPPKVRDSAAHIVDVAEERAPLTSVFEDLLSNPTPLKLAGTDKSSTVQEAHQEIVRPLLDWTTKWPEATQEIYDFWGKGNLARFLLNHRGFPNAFHVTVEATTVVEAREWARALCPLVDVLTILWKGPILGGGMAIVPVRCDYESPGGWGYAIAAGSRISPTGESDDKDWAPAMGWATLLPKDAVQFLFKEARALFKAGRLFLLPALNVGCIDAGHGPVERMFNDVSNASPIMSSLGNNSKAIRLDSLPLPYFPDVPLSELASLIEGEGDSLLETRHALRSWAKTISDRNEFETRAVMRECYERVESGLRAVERQFQDLARKLDWAQKDGTIYSYAFNAKRLEIQPNNLAAAELVALHSELHASPWYAYFRLSSQGYRWDLKRKTSTLLRKPREQFRPPERVHHWLVPPQSGWTIPSAVRMPISDTTLIQ